MNNRDSPAGLLGNGSIGAYPIVRELSVGVGGMSAVYEAKQPGDGAVVAVKVANERHYGQLLQEANTLLRIQHPNIIKILPILNQRAQPAGVHVALASVEGASRAFIVLEYLGGGSLQEMIAKERRIPARKAGRIASDVARGLAVAHAQGIIHLDIKPSNIMFDVNQARAVILDFGIARRSDDWNVTERRVLGSLSYAAPERLRRLPGDGRADIYSLGVCLFEMLSGVRPFYASDANALRVKVLTEPAPLLSSIDPALQTFDALLQRCLEKDPERRVPSATAFLEGLAPLVKRKAPAIPWYIGLAAAGAGAATIATAVAFSSTLGSRGIPAGGLTDAPTETATVVEDRTATQTPVVRPPTSTPVASRPGNTAGGSGFVPMAAGSDPAASALSMTSSRRSGSVFSPGNRQ